VTLSASREDGFACLEVKDDGPGIPAEQLPRLFDRYWQANRMDKRGVGLGLSIVKGIAAAHGGSIAVDTAVGRGSAFKLRLPVQQSI
jgi:signal transduction histidine kinase